MSTWPGSRPARASTRSDSVRRLLQNYIEERQLEDPCKKIQKKNIQKSQNSQVLELVSEIVDTLIDDLSV